VSVLAALVVAGCGSSSSSSKSGGSSSTPAATSAPKMGGNVTSLWVAGGVDSLDPGYWYYQTDYTDLGQTTQRTLYAWPAKATSPTPDLATALPTVSNGGKTITIHIRSGIHYSAPLASQTVTSADIKYAMDRCYAASVANGYAFLYYSNIAGAPTKPASKVPDVSGIQTPDPTTLVINTTVPVGVLDSAQALTLWCTAPVPQSYAAKYDSGATSSYGMHQVFTGPYMIQGAGSGTVPSSSYQVGKLLVLVRNPSWVRSTDPIRPAYFDSITFKAGGDPTVAEQQVLSGSSLMQGDIAVPPPAITKQAVTSYKSQTYISPSTGNRYIVLNTTIGPLKNANFRKAIAAITNRTDLRLTRGGPVVGVVATHFDGPAIPGFALSGGLQGPGDDFLANPNGSLAVAEKYMKAAGYPSGKYTGAPLLMIADNVSPAKETAEAFQSQLAQIGITVNLREVQHATMLSKYCEVPKSNYAICPNTGWSPDFLDGQGMLDAVFNGKNIVPAGNTNMSLANEPTLNQEMDAAEQLVDPAQRASAWSKIDNQVTASAFVVPWLWDSAIMLASKNVHGVQWVFNGSDWDLTASYIQ
jgi:peptide/nickel transport system substrate-binding protein